MLLLLFLNDGFKSEYIQVNNDSNEVNILIKTGANWELRTAVPNLFDIRDWFHGRQFFHGLGGGDDFRMIPLLLGLCSYENIMPPLT